MTAQAPDVLILDGQELPLYANPLDLYIEKLGQGWPFASAHTANWRGYVATWEIRDDTLFLLRIEGWLAKRPLEAQSPLQIRLQDSIAALPEGADPFHASEVPLDRFFAGASGPIMASWFSGALRIPRGRQLAYVHMGYESVHERELILTLESGRVVSSREIDRATEFKRELRERLSSFLEGRREDQRGMNRPALDPAVRASLEILAGVSSKEDVERAPDPDGMLRVLLFFGEGLDFREFQDVVRETLRSAPGEGPSTA